MGRRLGRMGKNPLKIWKPLLWNLVPSSSLLWCKTCS